MAGIKVPPDQTSAELAARIIDIIERRYAKLHMS